MKSTYATLAALLAMLAVGSGIVAQRELPPVSYVCPMSEHAEVLEDKPGKCPLCQMVLVPVRIDQAFSCPTHAAVITEKPGLCPLDKRELVSVIISRYWTCPDKPAEHLIDPGKCANGSPRKMVREQRAHGNHNPKHGGQFFMASDKWHHVEATHPRPGFFRVYVYDNFTNSIAIKEFSGRAVTREEFDSKTAKSRELEVATLRRSRDRQTLEAKINAKTLPAKVTLKMRFDPRLPEERFDFTFDEYSKEPPAEAVSSASATPNAAPAKNAPPQPAPLQPEPPPPAAAPVDPAPETVPQQAGMSPALPGSLAELFAALPRTSEELLSLLTEKSLEVQTLIQSGQLGSVYVPALLTKEAALALEGHLSGLTDRQRVMALSAIKRVVVAAWQLDAFGDLGNRETLESAYQVYASAIADLKAAYAPSR